MKSRRKFIEKVAISTAGLSLVGWNSPNYLMHLHNPASKEPKLKVALMGLGSYANRVAKAMQQCNKAIITGLISGTPEKLETWGEKYNVPKESRYNYENFDAIASNPNIDAVYIITPNALHHGQTIRVAKAGKHVICEKPMAISAQEGKEMVDACKKAGVKLLVGYRMHFEPNTLEVVNMRKQGDFGKIDFFQGLSGFNIGDPNQWRLDKALAGGGALVDIGIYSINGARYMVGEEPIWVTAQETKTNPEKFKEGVDETIQFQLGFPSGAVASCLSTYAMNNLDKFFLNGAKGFAQLHPATGYGPIKGSTHLKALTEDHTPQQTLQMDAMADILLKGTEPAIPVNGEEGLKDLKIIEAIYKAVDQSKKITLTL
ncbi:Gfo/Idh/MocA family oxidoreductase [Galbibacter sp. PAP.153]|uniref:Gfo/Idh/MocA family protein n=1 Tax=Galbibacter sp. PAP.153 TaxID=3104623 RepID=UPI00300B18ED